MTSQTAESLARKLVLLLTGAPYLQNSNYLSAAVNNEIASKEVITADLGDYLPFIYRFGGKVFSETHIKSLSKNFNPVADLARKGPLGLKTLYSYDFSDFLLGLAWYANETQDLEAKRLATVTLGFMKKTFWTTNQLRSIYLVDLERGLPIFDSRDGTFLEIMADYPEFFKDEPIQKRLKETLLEIAEPIFPALKASSYLTPLNNLSKPGSLFRKSILIKHIANPLHGLIAYNQRAQETRIQQTIFSLADYLLKNFTTKTGYFLHDSLGTIQSASNHTGIDLFCDMYHFYGNKDYLKVAQQAGDAWVKIQGKTGLFPLSPNSTDDDLDSQTDMIVALYKLSEVAGNDCYRLAADNCLEGVIKYHLRDDGMYLSVNTKTGKVVDPTYKTKFIALFLKALYLVAKNHKIYADLSLYHDLKDR